jgi:hypothetical protein
MSICMLLFIHLVMSLVLFLVFINDIADNLHSIARVFADDCVIYRPIHTEKDHQLMQEDLDTLVGWADTRFLFRKPSTFDAFLRGWSMCKLYLRLLLSSTPRYG